MVSKTIKKWVFWTHLIAGLIAGIFVLCMSFTGVLLTYERQIVEFSERLHDVEPAKLSTHVGEKAVRHEDEHIGEYIGGYTETQAHSAVSARISTDEVVTILQALKPNEPHIYVRWVNREGAAIPAWAGRYSFLLHPYTGEIL